MEVLDKRNYTLFINSNDKISGTNNNATFQINWDDFLPRNYGTYKMTFMFQTTGGNYLDFTANSNARFTGTIAATVLTIASITSGTIYIGQTCTGVLGVLPFTILSLASGTQSTVNATYNISTSQTVAAATAIIGTGVNNGNSITYNSSKVVLNNLGRSYSFDTSTMSPSTSLGIIQRDLQTTTSVSNTLSSFYFMNPSKTISRPNQNLINIQIYNLSYSTPTLLTTTDANGNTSTYAAGKTANNSLNSTVTDMTPWTMIIEFYTVEDSKVN